ncbi:MAG: neutral/alkaline non-lysosomal ceramidase N-terminal domain-containing protein [Kiritimatiellales bacterium]|nr:neutral/alkaline non-lysosomal ceramidase N-terminal domain-containing protein [Kiritimatiellales bacterium]
MSHLLHAGAAQIDISPLDSQFMAGYPHVERYSTGIHDPLLSSALYLSDGKTEVLFIANDLIFAPKSLVGRARRRIEATTGIPAANVMITATHTHSGPRTVSFLSHEIDSYIPKVDEQYLQLIEDGIVAAAIQAHQSAQPAQIGLAVADGKGVGTNRRDPNGPADPAVPVLWVRSIDGSTNIALMLVCCMHPTVLHGDSTLISGDFPAMTRQYLQVGTLGVDCPVIYHTGPQGNQSPRHVTRENTFAEAVRLGEILGRSVEKVMPGIEFSSDISLSVTGKSIELVPKKFPSLEVAEERLQRAMQTLKQLRESDAPSTKIRTAEVDWFGAEETLILARAALDGRIDAAMQRCTPAEIQIISVGEWRFVGWQGEVFVEYDLQVKEQAANTFIIGLANGELHGYIVTPEAAEEGGYEASNSLFAPESGRVLVQHTLAMLKR